MIVTLLTECLVINKICKLLENYPLYKKMVQTGSEWFQRGHNVV